MFALLGVKDEDKARVVFDISDSCKVHLEKKLKRIESRK